MKIIETHIPKELLKKGYWLNLDHWMQFIVVLEIDKDRSVKATAFQAETNYINIDWQKLENGEEIYFFNQCFESDWWIEIDIWGKYFFPKFNEEKNQWYHNDLEGKADYIKCFTDLLKKTYEIAMKVSELKTY